MLFFSFYSRIYCVVICYAYEIALTPCRFIHFVHEPTFVQQSSSTLELYFHLHVGLLACRLLKGCCR